MRMSFPFQCALVAAFVLVAASPVAGQHFSFGVMGGVGLGDDFKTEAFTGNNSTIEIYSNSKSYLVGPMVELGLPLHLSVEADGLYRPLHYMDDIIVNSGSALRFNNPNTVVTWEFPLLAKYKWSLPLVKPFVGLGPSFRTAGNVNGSNPSNHGFTAGGGVEIHLGRVKIAPQVRYTRWAKDSVPTAVSLPMQAFTNPNQGEFLVGFFF